MDLWVRSSAPNVDLQATISEVRPDGKETFVQGGWVRAKARKLDAAKSTELEPVLSLRQEDFAPMPSDQFVPVTIPLYYEGHMYRAGSRIRVRISAPNGDQPIWAFAETEPAGQADVAIGYGAEHALAPRASGGPRRQRADRAAAVPGPARRAVPRLPATRQRARFARHRDRHLHPSGRPGPTRAPQAEPSASARRRSTPPRSTRSARCGKKKKRHNKK